MNIENVSSENETSNGRLGAVSGSIIDIPLQYCPKCRSLEIQQKTKSHDNCKDCGHVWDIYRPWDNLS